MNSRPRPGPKSHITDRTSLTLLERVRKNDDAAWQRLVDLYSPLVFLWCRRCNLSSEDASDNLQEVFATVARKIGDFRRDREGDTFRGWLRQITRNQIRMHFRKNKKDASAVGGSTVNARLQELPDSSLDESPESASEEQQLIHRRALELIQTEFEDRTWKAFVQTAVDGRSAADVAADLNMSPGAVRQAKYKVVGRLRAELADVLL